MPFVDDWCIVAPATNFIFDDATTGFHSLIIVMYHVLFVSFESHSHFYSRVNAPKIAHRTKLTNFST